MRMIQFRVFSVSLFLLALVVGGQALTDQQRQAAAPAMEALPPDNPLRGRVNLLNWDGRGMPDGMFPTSDEGADR